MTAYRITPLLLCLIALRSGAQDRPLLPPPPPPPAVTVASFGKLPSGEEISIYTLSSGAGLEARVMTLGATLVTVSTPDASGKPAPITLHKDALADYVKGHPLYGSVVGRYANRIANAKFTIGDADYALEANNGRHHIHGGKPGFANSVWRAEKVAAPLSLAGENLPEAVSVKFSLNSPDGQAGFPGTVEASVTYTVTDDNRLILEYAATTDKPTHVNLTNHAYWNLEGVPGAEADAPAVADHLVRINADRYLVADESLIPTGEIRGVYWTARDFRTARSIASRLGQLDRKNYDDCYVINAPSREGAPALAARVVAPVSGRTMEVYTTEPGVQFYTGHPKGLCLETQHFPDSPNHPEFPPTLLKPGQAFRSATVYKFGTRETAPSGRK